MLIHILNLALKARNAASVVPLRWTPVFTLPLGNGLLTWRIVDAWCIERPSGELVGDYTNPVSAFAVAWRMVP